MRWGYEQVTFRLAENTTYTPDFYVLRPDGTGICFETKGFWTQSARVKTKVTAEAFSEFVFVGVTRARKGEGIHGFTFEVFPPWKGEKEEVTTWISQASL